MGDEANRPALEVRIEGMGFTGVSEAKDRAHVRSMHVRSLGGALVELVRTPPKGRARDQAPGAIVRSLMVPPWLGPRRAAPMEERVAADLR